MAYPTLMRAKILSHGNSTLTGESANKKSAAGKAGGAFMDAGRAGKHYYDNQFIG